MLTAQVAIPQLIDLSAGRFNCAPEGCGVVAFETGTWDYEAAWISFVEPRPDGRIRRGATGGYKGDNIYNTAGTGQTVVGSAARGGTVTYFVSVQNDAPFPDALRLRGTDSTGRFRVTYTAGGASITRGVTAGTYLTPVLAPGETFAVKVRVTVSSTAPAGSSLSATLAAKSNTVNSYKDTVKFTTRRA